ncbi:hypothetical protein KFX41_19145, partial [Bacteroides thetaiotaomicron]|nr:hypothetical protein [Bacteroides thetaiotaomicron]
MQHTSGKFQRGILPVVLAEPVESHQRDFPVAYRYGVSGKSRALLPPSPLRTVRESFPSYGS